MTFTPPPPAVNRKPIRRKRFPAERFRHRSARKPFPVAPLPFRVDLPLSRPNSRKAQKKWQLSAADGAWKDRGARRDQSMTKAVGDVKSIFGKALEIQAPAERVAFLDGACGGDTSLRHEVDGLLQAL